MTCLFRRLRRVGVAALVIAVVSVAAASSAGQASAIEIYDWYPWLFAADENARPNPRGAPSLYLLLRGEIEPGDADFFEQVMIDRLLDGGGHVGVVVLDSPGGNLAEAIRIGEMVRRLHISTQIGDHGVKDAVCASACFFVFAGGVKRSVVWSGQDWPAVVLHRPYFEAKDFSRLSATGAAATYGEVEALAKDYLERMGVPDALSERIFATRSTSADSLTPQDMFALRWMAPFLDELLISRCGDLSIEEKRRLEALLQANQPTAGEPALERRTSINRCRVDSLAKERAASLHAFVGGALDASEQN